MKQKKGKLAAKRHAGPAGSLGPGSQRTFTGFPFSRAQNPGCCSHFPPPYNGSHPADKFTFKDSKTQDIEPELKEWRRRQLERGQEVSEDTPHPTQRSPWGSSSLPQGCREKLQDHEAAPRDSTSAREARPSSLPGTGSPGLATGQRVLQAQFLVPHQTEL